MFTFLVALIIIIAVVLILAVLVQSSKKEGLGNPLGEVGASQLIGVKETSSLLEQITWGLIIALFILTLATSLFLSKADDQHMPYSPNIDRAQEHGTLPHAAQQDDVTPQENTTPQE